MLHVNICILMQMQITNIITNISCILLQGVKIISLNNHAQLHFSLALNLSMLQTLKYNGAYFNPVRLKILIIVINRIKG